MSPWPNEALSLIDMTDSTKAQLEHERPRLVQLLVAAQGDHRQNLGLQWLENQARHCRVQGATSSTALNLAGSPW